MSSEIDGHLPRSVIDRAGGKPGAGWWRWRRLNPVCAAVWCRVCAVESVLVVIDEPSGHRRPPSFSWSQPRVGGLAREIDGHSLALTAYA